MNYPPAAQPKPLLAAASVNVPESRRGRSRVPLGTSAHRFGFSARATDGG
jgi:hypothetical protein